MLKNPVAVATIRTCRKSYKYRIYPTKSQVKTLEKWLDLSRELYNSALEERRESWKEKISTSYNKQAKDLPELKKTRPEYKEVHSQVLQQNLIRLDRAFQSFFKRVKNGEKPGYPRFKSADRFNSLVYPQAPGFKLVSRKKLHLSGIGEIKIKLHRDVLGEPKTCSIKRTPSGHWYASFSCDQVPVEDWPEATGEVGIDPGLESFATLSNGENETKIENPRWFRKSEERLAKAQRELQPKKCGSKRRSKARQRVAKIHEKIANQRDDFQHKLARKIVSENKLIAIEDTDVKEMLETSPTSRNKSIQDAAWNGFSMKLSCKASNAGRIFVLVPAPGTSSTCSQCGFHKKKELSERTHQCGNCGLVLDRDVNAARNILRLGRSLLGSNSREAAGL